MARMRGRRMPGDRMGEGGMMPPAGAPPAAAPQGPPRAPTMAPAPRAPMAPQGPGMMPVSRPQPMGGMGVQAPPLRRPLPPPEPMMAGGGGPGQMPVNRPQPPMAPPAPNAEWMGGDDGDEDDLMRRMGGAYGSEAEMAAMRQGYPGDAAMRLRGMSGAAATPYEVGQFPAGPPRPGLMGGAAMSPQFLGDFAPSGGAPMGGAMGQGSTLGRLLAMQMRGGR